MTIEKKLLTTNPVSGEVLPEAVSFDSGSDFIVRESDLTGNSNGKTFTVSFWFYLADTNVIPLSFQGEGMSIDITPTRIKVSTKDSSGNNAAEFTRTTAVPKFTWCHVVVSADLTNSSNRYVCLNDEVLSTSWNAYNNVDIGFSGASWIKVGRRFYQHTSYKSRMAHVFLDYTYRDLSVTSNRRLFITADGKPSDTIPSSPILYLPMKDAATAGVNSGTGGNFNIYGVLATAERGPNQDNCVASTFDGSNDYLNKTNGNSLSNSKTITCAFTFMPLAGNNTSDIIIFDDYNVGGGGAQGFVQLLSGNRIRASFELTGTGLAGRVQTQALLTFGVQYAVAISFDTANSNKTKIYINGVLQDLYENTMNNIVCEIDMNYVNIGRNRRNASNFVKGQLGELYFHNTWTDLATENPFWDSDTNRPNSLRKVIADTGVTPAIAMPLIGNDAGNNLGSGGDFTVNSGPYTGARGGSEFRARGAKGNGSTGYLSRAGVGMSNSKTVSGLICFNIPANSGFDYLFATRQSSGYLPYFKIMYNASSIYLDGANTDESRIFQMNFGYSANTSYVLLFTIDMADSNKSYVSLNGTVSANYTTYTNAEFGFSEAGETSIMSLGNGSHSSANINSFYLTTNYIDFTQEANRNKFVSQLGYPKDLTQQIEDGDIPNPNIYMKFDDTDVWGIAALGTNSGSGGNFTVNGTVTAGADFIL